MTTFARNTEVSSERSQEQIKWTLRRYGCDGFGVMENANAATVMFSISAMTIRIDVPLPDRNDESFVATPTGRRRRNPDMVAAAWEQAVKQRWRALLLAIKAKLEAVETGISTLETEFMPFVVCPDGQTIGQHLLPKLREVAASGRMPKLLEMA